MQGKGRGFEKAVRFQEETSDVLRDRTQGRMPILNGV